MRFDTVGALLRALDERPPSPALVQTRDADDHRALQRLSRNAEVIGLATNPGAVRLLWEVCQIPDFRKVMSDSHARFLAQCFGHLAGPAGRLPSAWVGAQMAQLDRLDGVGHYPMVEAPARFNAARTTPRSASWAIMS